MFEIKLDLSSHCIHTEIKRLYNRALSQCIGKKDHDSAVVAKLELLKRALETIDFPLLRGRYRELSGGADSDVRLLGYDNGQTAVSIDGVVVWRC